MRVLQARSQRGGAEEKESRRIQGDKKLPTTAAGIRRARGQITARDKLINVIWPLQDRHNLATTKSTAGSQAQMVSVKALENADCSTRRGVAEGMAMEALPYGRRGRLLKQGAGA
jgi:hypothetical protein